MTILNKLPSWTTVLDGLSKILIGLGATFVIMAGIALITTTKSTNTPKYPELPPLVPALQEVVNDLRPDIRVLSSPEITQYKEYLGGRTGTVLSVDMKENIGMPDQYIELGDILGTLTSNDVVIFKLHNNGGYVKGLSFLANAVTNTKALTISDVDGETASAGAMLACMTNYTLVSPYSYLMYHAGSAGFSGKASDSLTNIKDWEVGFRLYFEQCVKKGILKQSQIDEIINGRDIYVRPKNIIDNIKEIRFGIVKEDYMKPKFDMKEIRSARVEITSEIKAAYENVYAVFNKLKQVSGVHNATLRIEFDPNPDCWTEMETNRIMITTGMLGIAEGDMDEVAHVLGHELYHAMTQTGGTWKSEYAADKGGTKLANKAGYNGKKGGIEFLSKLMQLYGGDDSDAEHPPLKDRIERLKRM